MIESEKENPFLYSYITEKIRDPSTYFEYFSPYIFVEGVFRISQPMNHFLVGAPGCGKTMLLRFFWYKSQMHLWSNDNLLSWYQVNILRRLPKKFIGIYYTIPAGPYTYFQGSNIDNSIWARHYGNYLNLVILEELLRMLNKIKNESSDVSERWMENMEINLTDENLFRAIKDFTSTQPIKELLGECKNFNEIYQSVYEILDIYHAVLSKPVVSEEDLPKTTIDSGRVPVDFALVLRKNKILPPDMRIFILLDEYHVLGQVENNLELARVINSAIMLAARSRNSHVEFKIGTRRYGLKDKRILFSETEIEKLREYDEIDIEGVFNTGIGGKLKQKTYMKFVEDLTEKRIQRIEGFKNNSMDKIFTKLSAEKEASVYWEKNDKYLENITLSLRKHIEDKVKTKDREYIINCVNRMDNPLDMVSAAIILMNILRKGELENFDDANIMNQFNEKLKIKSLFILARLSNKSVRYAGYKTIVNTSFPVVLLYLEICRELWQNNINYFEADSSSLYFSPTAQDISIRNFSRKKFQEIFSETSPNGSKISHIIVSLASLFRATHLEISSAIFATGFRIENMEFNKIDKKLKLLLDECVSLSILQRRNYKDWIEFSLSKILCPYFNLSVRMDTDSILLTGNNLQRLIKTSEKSNVISEILKPYSDPIIQQSTIFDFYGKEQ